MRRLGSLALLASFVVSLELTARLEDWVRYRTPLLSPITSQGDLVVRDRDGAHGRPYARYQKWVMNGLGMRGPEAGAAKAPGSVRVLTVGASETFGLYESPDREFPRQLEDSLNVRAEPACGSPSPHFEVLNAALPGMSLPTVEQDVQRRLRRLEPDFIAVYPTPSQYLDTRPPVAARPDSSGRSVAIPESRALHPRIVDRLRNQVKLLLPEAAQTWLRRRETAASVRRHPPGWRFTSLPAERLALFELDLRRLIGSVRASGAEPILATHANTFMRPGARDAHTLASWEKFYPRATGDVIVAFDSAARLVTLRVGADSGVAVVDAAATLARAGGDVFTDFSHFTDRGASLMAKSFADEVAARARLRGLCGSGAPPRHTAGGTARGARPEAPPGERTGLRLAALEGATADRAWASEAGKPELPRVYLDTPEIAPTGRTRRVRSGGDLQAALDAARPGDVVSIDAGATFVGNFILRRKAGSGWITVRSTSRTPAGRRVAPRDAAGMAKLATPDKRPALRTEPGAHHFRIIGLEITARPEVTENFALVALGDGSSAQNTLSTVPHDLVLDRVYVHGTKTLDVRRCVALNSATTAVIDSYLSECHSKGFDAQAIGSWNGPGPFKIVNNYLEGSTENIAFGGSDPAIPDLVPSDVEIRGNYLFKPLSWKGVWLAKNLLEIKSGRRVLIEGNVLENSWVGGQVGFAVLLWSVNQQGRCTWCVTEDVTVRYNIIKNVGGGFNLNERWNKPSPPMARVLIQHTLFEGVVGAGVGAGGPGNLFQMGGAIGDLTIEHNTGFSTASQFAFGTQPPRVLQRLTIRDNVGGSRYNVHGPFGQGATALRQYGGSAAVFRGNVVVGGTQPRPSGNYYPATAEAAGLVSDAGRGMRLRSSSAFRGRATDRTDPGADVDSLARVRLAATGA